MGGTRVERVVPARIGLVGNPSDGFGGAVLAAPVGALAAHVSADRSGELVVRGGGVERRWRDRAAFDAELAVTGHVGADRIVTAALARLVSHIGRRLRPDDAVTIEWSTTVPVSVGLAGSSALAVGVIEAAAACWGHRLDPRVVAALALSCEVDLLGVAAGWQDRVVQAHRAVVLVDAGRLARVDGLDVPTVTSVHPVRPARFVVGWAATGASSSGDYHGALRDPGRTNPAVVRAGMGDLADLARAAATSLATGDLDGLGRAIDLGWATRQQIAPLRADHAALVEAVREIGAPATTPGSGGAVVALARTATDEDRLGVRLDALGAAHLTVELS